MTKLLKGKTLRLAVELKLDNGEHSYLKYDMYKDENYTPCLDIDFMEQTFKTNSAESILVECLQHCIENQSCNDFVKLLHPETQKPIAFIKTNPNWYYSYNYGEKHNLTQIFNKAFLTTHPIINIQFQGIPHHGLAGMSEWQALEREYWSDYHDYYEYNHEIDDETFTQNNYNQASRNNEEAKDFLNRLKQAETVTVIKRMVFFSTLEKAKQNIELVAVYTLIPYCNPFYYEYMQKIALEEKYRTLGKVELKYIPSTAFNVLIPIAEQYALENKYHEYPVLSSFAVPYDISYYTDTPELKIRLNAHMECIWQTH